MLRKIKYIIPVAFAIALASCTKKTFDINSNPNKPLALPISKILPVVELNLGASVAIGSGISNVLEVYTHQLSTREEADQYGATANNFYISAMWNDLYITALNNIENIISQGTADGNLRYVGIAKVLKAYAFSQLVDVFADVPFSEANKLRAGLNGPKFDKGQDIYPQLFTLIDAGIADMNNATATNLLKPGSDDVIYTGDITKWIKAANTIKLKLLVQQRLVKNVAADAGALLTANNLITQTSESFLLPYGPNAATDDRNPGFGDYISTQRSNSISPWFYEILKGYNPNIFKNNPDPRVPYYWYNQLKPTQAPREGNQTEYRDGGFVSLYFGSVGPDRDRSMQNSITVLGIYPVGGRYDDGGGAIAGATSGTGAAPYRFLTYADRLYLEAELNKIGVVAGDARAKLLAAINESFKQVDYVITTYVKPGSAGAPQTTVPALVGSAGVTTYINNVMAEYDANPSKQLQIIMTQKWISSFGSAVDQYTDYRRTGFPILFNPKDPTMAPGGRVQPPIAGDPVNPVQKSVPVQLNRPFSLSLPWPSGELNTNANAPAPKTDLSTYKPFWLP